VEAALTDHISSNISALLQQDPPADEDRLPSTAVFYSINNCLPGLRGISFGNFLIKQVIEHLAVEAPHITTYVTLSPVPGFMRWLAGSPADLATLDELQRQAIAALLADPPAAEAMAGSAPLQAALPVLCARYLVQAKSRNKPADPVARFHLGNGARLERINWMADSSDNGMAQSAGLMVNYLYNRHTLARNHEAYEQQHEVVYSQAVKKLLS
jgi:malonyl-CoA decarboxylase